MTLTGEHVLPVSRARAWAALTDAALLQAALPGCESLTQVGDDSYRVQLALALGPLTAHFDGGFTLAALQPPQQGDVAFDGSAGLAGHGKGRAQLRLTALSPRRTQLSYTARLRLGGALAHVGPDLVALAVRRLGDDFIARLRLAMRRRR